MEARNHTIPSPTFGFYDTVHSTAPSKHLSLDQLKELIKAPYDKDKAALPLIVPHDGQGKTVAAADTANYWAAVIDYDGVQQGIFDIVTELEKHTYGGALLYFTTSSHGSTIDKHGQLKHRNHYKIILPFASAVYAETYHRVSAGLSLLLSSDTAQARVQQGFYAPNSKTQGLPYEGDAMGLDDGFLTPDCELYKAAISAYNTHEASKIAKAEASQPKPRALAASSGGGGIIDLINDAYDMPSLLKAYGHELHNKKWLSPRSSTGIAGGVILSGGRFYSHHGATCPLSSDNHDGHSLDVADVLCALKYKGDYLEMVAAEAQKLDQDKQKQRQRDYRKAQERITVVDFETGEIYTPEPSKHAQRICNGFITLVKESLQLEQTEGEIAALLDLDAYIVDRIISETMRNGGRKDEFLVLTKGEILNNHSKREAWPHILHTYGAPYNHSKLDELREAYCLAQGIDPNSKDTQAQYKALATKLKSPLQNPIYFHIEQHNQRSAVSYRVDMFAQNRSVIILEKNAAFTLTHKPIAARNDLATANCSQAIIDDYLEHFPEFEEVLQFLVMARFAPDRKKAYLWLHAPSDWGKGLFKSALKNMGVMAELSVKEVEAMFEGKPVGKDPDDFKRALCLVFDEFKSVKSELKQLENSITLTPKFKMASEVEVFGKLFLSAENVASLVGVSGIEDQLANRFSCIIGKGEIHKRPLFNTTGSGEYLRHVVGYAQARINSLIETMRKKGRTDAERAAEVFINSFHTKHGIDKLGQRLSESLGELAEEFLAYLVGEFEADFSHSYLFKNANQKLCLRNGGKVLLDWLEDSVDPSELGTLKFKRNEILALISEDETGKTKPIRQPNKGVVAKAIELRALKDHPQNKTLEYDDCPF